MKIIACDLILSFSPCLYCCKTATFPFLSWWILWLVGNWNYRVGWNYAFSKIQTKNERKEGDWGRKSERGEGSMVITQLHQWHKWKICSHYFNKFTCKKTKFVVEYQRLSASHRVFSTENKIIGTHKFCMGMSGLSLV